MNLVRRGRILPGRDRRVAVCDYAPVAQCRVAVGVSLWPRCTVLDPVVRGFMAESTVQTVVLVVADPHAVNRVMRHRTVVTAVSEFSMR